MEKTFDIWLFVVVLGWKSEWKKAKSVAEHAMRLLDVAFIPAGQFIMSAFSLKCLRHFRNKIGASFVIFQKSVVWDLKSLIIHGDRKFIIKYSVNSYSGRSWQASRRGCFSHRPWCWNLLWGGLDDIFIHFHQKTTE